MAKKPESDLVSDPAIAGNSGSWRNTDIQQAVEAFVQQHAAGKAKDPASFAEGYPQHMRAEILSQCREFLTFDGLLGTQEWLEPQAEPEDGRAFGDFLIQEELGRGGMGVVYLAKQKSLNRRVALKVMASGLTLSKRHVERFRREAMATAQLIHRAIVPVHSLIEVDGTFALAMDFVAGRNLADMLDDLRLANNEGEGVAVGTLGIAPEKGYVAECAMLVAEVASALAVAHHNQVVHRDLKPRNLMIDDRRQVRLLDFGLAKSLDATRESLSMSGEITGTAHYMSPEQTLAKRVEIDHRADIWSLGVILYEILTLRRPFDGKNLQQIVYEICFKEPVPLQRRNAKVPRDLVTICQKALEKDPIKRYQTAAEFEADLQRFLRWEPVHAKPASTWTRAAKFVRRHRTESAIAAVALIVTTVVMVWVMVTNAQNDATVMTLLQRAEARSLVGDYKLAIDLTNQALVIRNDPRVRDRLGRYHAENTGIENEAAWKATRSQQLLEYDRQGALTLALEAENQLSSALTRSAVLDALGKGWVARTLPTKQRAVEGGWSPSGEHIVIGGYGGSLQFFRTDQDENPITLAGHDTKFPIAAVAFAGEDRIVSVGIDQTMRLWQPELRSTPQTVKLPGLASTLHVSEDGQRALVTTYGPGRGSSPGMGKAPFRAQVWNTIDGAPVSEPMDHDSPIRTAAISPDGLTAATVSSRGHTPRLWRINDATMIAECIGMDSSRTGARPQVTFSPDNKLCAIGTYDGAVRIYAAHDGALLATIRHSKPITSIAFDQASRRLLSGSRDLTARLWQIERTREADQDRVSLREIGVLLGHTGAVTQVAFDSTGQLAATATERPDTAIRIFDVGSGRPPGGAAIHSYGAGRSVQRMAFAKDSRRILSLAGPRSLVWDFGTASGVVTLRQPGTVPAVAFVGDDSRIATAGDDERLRLWQTRDGRQVWVSKRLGMPLFALDVDPKGRWIACSDVDGVVHMLSTTDGTEQFTLNGHPNKVPAVRFFDDGTQLLTAGCNPANPVAGRAILWDLPNQNERRTLDRPQPIKSADINKAGTLMVTVEGEERFARLWSVPDMKARGKVGDHTGIVRHAEFSPDGNDVLTASDDHSARIYRLNGDLTAEIQTGARVKHATFSADGLLVLTCKENKSGAAQLWRVTDGTEVVHFNGHRDSLVWGTFNGATTWVATSARDGTTCIWPTDPVSVAERLPSQNTSTTTTSTLPK